jgi:hypothetical protein
MGMRRQAVAAAVDLGDCKRQPLAGLGVEGTFLQGAIQAEIAFERRRAVGDHAEQVRHDTELLLGAFKQGRLRSMGW